MHPDPGMYELVYHGSCPKGDPECFGITLKIWTPRDVDHTSEITVCCPIEALTGQICPDGGRHTLTAATDEPETKP